MSYILEALRKAQQEQQRGQAPDLRAAVGIAAAEPRRRRLRWGWAAAALVLGINTLVLGWILWPRPPAPLPASLQTPLLPGAEDPPPEARLAAAPPAPAEPRGTGALRLPPETRPLAAEAERRSPPRTAVSEPQQSSSEVAEAAAPLPPRTSAQPAPLPSAPEAPPAAAEPVPAPPLPPEAPGRTAPRAIQGAGPVPFFHELPPEVRQGLPALEINGHVYSDDPSERFVFIHWKPYREGDRLGAADGPVLERITPEGVVVDFGSVRARVPVLP